MAAGTELTPTEYIGHHLTHATKTLGDGGFWTLHLDSLIVSILLGFVGMGFVWWVVKGATAGVPGKRQAFVEILFEFIDEQAKAIFHHGNRHTFVAPAALTVFLLMIMFSVAVKGLGGWLHELFCSPFGSNPLLWPFNFIFNCIEYLSKPLSHSLRLYGNMYAGEIIFLLLWLWAANSSWAADFYIGAGASALLGLGW